MSIPAGKNNHKLDLVNFLDASFQMKTLFRAHTSYMTLALNWLKCVRNPSSGPPAY